jgi:hypothetical protein
VVDNLVLQKDYIEQLLENKKLNKAIETMGRTSTTQSEVIEDMKSTTKAQIGIIELNARRQEI